MSDHHTSSLFTKHQVCPTFGTVTQETSSKLCKCVCMCYIDMCCTLCSQACCPLSFWGTLCLSLSWHHNGISHLRGARITDAHHHVQLFKTFILAFYVRIHFSCNISPPSSPYSSSSMILCAGEIDISATRSTH